MDTALIAFMGFIAVAMVIMVVIMVSFMAMIARTMSRVGLNPQPEPPLPYVPQPAAPQPPKDEITIDQMLGIEDFIPDPNKPITVVVKEDEHGHATES